MRPSLYSGIMPRRLETIAIIASEECKHGLPEGRRKSWFHVREFLNLHYEMLQRFAIISTDGTAEILDETTRIRQGSHRLSFVPLKVKRIGPTARGVSRLAAMVAEGEVGRVLFFQDPRDLEMDKPENYALLRNCDLHGRMLCINESAQLWAEYEEAKGKPLAQRAPRITGKETVALIAHDGEKERMALFVQRHRQLLGRFPRIVATSGTKVFVERFLEKIHDECDRNDFMIQPLGKKPRGAKRGHGPAGGDVIIADEIYRTFEGLSDKRKRRLLGPLHHILFFMDHKHSQPHEPDIRVLLRTCVNPELRVNLILNSQMANEWIKRYERRVPAQSIPRRLRAGDPKGFDAATLRAS